MIGQSIGEESGDGVVGQRNQSQCEWPLRNDGLYAEIVVDIARIYPDGTHSSPIRRPTGIRGDLAP